MTLGELTQVLAGKCDGRERHLRQTKLGCGGEGTGVACMQVGGSCQHWEAGEPARSDHSLDRCLASPCTAHSGQTLHKPLSDCNHDTFIRQFIALR